jgi:hypothetical protein
MSEPLRIDTTRSTNAPDGDKDARIEQLLLSGLDHYFAGQYEQAINIWTRVVFLERGHDRARAYIERARSALAERHRESEELLHRGVAAFDRGETDEARDLITRAVERGGPHDDIALVFLERLNRLGGPVPVTENGRTVPATRSRAKPAPDTPERDRWRTMFGPAAILGLIAAAITGLTLGGVPINEWIEGLPPAQPEERIVTVPPEPVPVARSSELLIARARSLQAGGHLRDALRALDAIDLADPMRATADRLRAELQRQLLEAGRARSRSAAQ